MVKKTGKLLSWLIPLAVAIALGLMLSVVLHQLDVGAEERDQQHAEIVALQAGLEEANARLEAGGERPVPVPSVSPGADPPPVVPIAPSRAQILSAFDIWCQLESCHGSDGDDGKPGKDAPPMTRQEIFTGFSAWCSTDPRCVGQPGADGTNGADSTVPGPPGRPPTPEEVLAAVEIVCADDACVGPQGVHGVQGAQGIQGPPGTAKPGSYSCPDDEHVTGFTVAEDGAVTLACQAPTPPVIDPPSPGDRP